MELLLKINSGDVASQLPDKKSFFKNQEVKTIDGQFYLYCFYTGDKQLTSDYDVLKFKKETSQVLPTVELTNIIVSSPNAKLVGKIWWVPKTEAFTITATANGLPNGGLMVMVERVLNGYQPIDDIRFVATIENGQVTMQGKFEQSGNYIITAKRLNEGLERIGAPFRLEFETMEFDAYV